MEAGTDIFYPEALQSREEIKRVCDALKDCLLYVGTKAITPPITAQEEYKELGLCMATCHVSEIVSVTTYDFLVELRDRGISAYNDFRVRTKTHPLGGYGKFDLTGFPKIAEWERKYLPKKQLEKYERTLGMYNPREGHGH